MKKWMLALLALLLLALPCAGLAEDGASRRDIPLDSDEFATLFREVCEANQLPALLERHESVTLDMTDVPENDNDWVEYCYMTREASYYETSDYSIYETDRKFCYLASPDAGGQLRYGLDMSSDYDLLDVAGYSFVPEDEAEWLNPETEEIEACYIEDGRLYIRAKIKPEASEVWFAENMPLQTYDGEKVHAELIADAETRDIIETNNYLEDGNGAMTRVIHFTAAYDEPQPRRLLNMLWAIDRYCEKTVEVTMIVDPGTDHEHSGSITAPVGSNFTYRVDNLERAVIFDDPEGTTITHFDGMKDRTYYVFTDPTDEQFESYQAQVQAIQEALER